MSIVIKRTIDNDGHYIKVYQYEKCHTCGKRDKTVSDRAGDDAMDVVCDDCLNKR